MAQAPCERVLLPERGDLVDERLDREDVREGAEGAQRRSPERHGEDPMALDAAGGKGVGRDRIALGAAAARHRRIDRGQALEGRGELPGGEERWRLGAS